MTPVGRIFFCAVRNGDTIIVVQGHRVRQKLRNGKPVVALLVNFLHAGLIEYLGLIGFDCLIIDGEHKGFSSDDLEHAVRACDLTGSDLLLHVKGDDLNLQRHLSAGVAGFHVAQVSSTHEIEHLIDESKFPPIGHRGIGVFRANRYGRTPEPWAAFWERANDEILVVPAVEDTAGLAALPGLLQMPAVDVVHIGQGDLSASLGFPGDTKNATVRRAVDDALAAILQSGKVAGLGASTPAEMRDVYDRGVRFILMPFAKVILAGTDAILSTLRELESREEHLESR